MSTLTFKNINSNKNENYSSLKMNDLKTTSDNDNMKNVDEELPLPPPPPPESFLDFNYADSEIQNKIHLETNNNNVNNLTRKSSFNKMYDTPSTFLPNSSFLPSNLNKSQNALKRSHTLTSSSNSPLNNKLSTLTARLNRLSINNRCSTSSFASSHIQRRDIHHLFEDVVIDDLEEIEDDMINDEESIELNTTSSPSSSSCSKEISSSSSSSSSGSSSSASSVIYSTNNTDDLNKLNESSTTNSDYQSNQIIDKSLFKTNSRLNQNEKLISQILRNKTNDQLNNTNSIIYSTGTFKPPPPSRSSSLQYRTANLTNNNNQKSKFYQLMTNNQNIDNNVYNNLINDNKNISFDRGSIYSTFSLRASNLTKLSSVNLKNNNNSNTNNENIYGTRNESANLLNKKEIFKIESCYKSMCSIVNSAKCLAELHTTNLENLVRLLDWKHQQTGVPVWVFNTGLNPKRKKELSLVLADKNTGFALWKLSNINFMNDFKWTKPGHLTFKIFAWNLSNPESFGLINQSSNINTDIIGQTKGAKVKKRFSLKKSNSLTNQQQQEFLNIKSSNTIGNINERNDYIFGVLKFDNDFECTKFYDYYKSILVDSKNNDLFNPNFNFNNKSATICGNSSLSFTKSKEKPSSSNIVKILYKKITKNSISSPCAFTHINGLSVLNEEAMLNQINFSTPSSNIIGLDSQSMLISNSNESSSILTPNDSIVSKS